MFICKRKIFSNEIENSPRPRVDVRICIISLIEKPNDSI